MDLKYTVRQEHNGYKLGGCLKAELGFSSTMIRRIKVCDGASVNGTARHMGHIVLTGDVIQVHIPDKPTSEVPCEIGLSPIYLDDYIFAIDKPAGIGMYRMHSDDDVNIIAGVLAMQRRLGMPESPIRPTSRLDRDTTGVILFARFPHIQHQLQLKQNYSKEYLLITDGIPDRDSGIIDLPIGKDDIRSFRMSCSPEGKPALTEFNVLDKCGDHCLVSARLLTGRTHQLRVHFMTIGCPIHGDTLYGNASPEICGQALHCQRVTFRHPVSGETTIVEAPLHREFLNSLEVCGLRLPAHI